MIITHKNNIQLTFKTYKQKILTHKNNIQLILETCNTIMITLIKKSISFKNKQKLKIHNYKNITIKKFNFQIKMVFSTKTSKNKNQKTEK